MKVFQKLLEFYINASIHIALAVYAMVRITEFYFDLSYNENLNYFIFYATITGYNFVKYAGVAKLHHRSLTNDLKVIQIFSFLCFIAMCYYGHLVAIKTLLFAAPFTLLTILYAVPFLSGFEKNLRQISYLKIIVVALVWCGFSVLIPLFDTGVEVSTKVVGVALQRFLLIIVLILPFDIRDVKYDAISLQTIPKKIGVEKTKRLGVALLVICLLLEFISTTTNVTKTPFMMFFFLTIVLLMRAKINQPKYYSSFFVEALPIVWWLILFGFDKF